MKALRTFLLTLLVLVVLGAASGLLLIRRGSRATTMPTVWEGVVARTRRGWAVPASERSKKNPVAATSDALQQGRELFLTQCAACHGIDGGGTTPMGLNLYPRVPDLRAGSTQSLSDGEIHYIIDNGVELTGMPAWGNPHQVQNADGWKLVFYIRSLRGLTQQEQAQETQTSSSAHYVGSQACEKCHA